MKRERGDKEKKRRTKSGIKVRAHLFPLRSRHLSKLYPISFAYKILSICKLGDFQGLNIYTTPFLATLPKSPGSPKDIINSNIKLHY